MPRARNPEAETRASFNAAAERIARLRRGLEAKTPAGVRRIGEEIMTDVKASRPGAGVPRDTGTLASTARVTGPNSKGEVILSFGGQAAPYALEQHERTDFSHRLGEARYLVRGLERWQPDGSAAMAALKANAQAAVDVVAAEGGR